MSLPTLIPEEHIQALEERRQSAYDRVLASFSGGEETKLDKERWVEVYHHCLSPKTTSRITGISMSRYRKWRATDPDFCKALNSAILEAREELMGSVLARATGYLKADDSTESGFEEDATGLPIRYGASDSLAKTLLETDKKGQDSSGVVVHVDFPALIGEDQ